MQKDGGNINSKETFLFRDILTSGFTSPFKTLDLNVPSRKKCSIMYLNVTLRSTNKIVPLWI